MDAYDVDDIAAAHAYATGNDGALVVAIRIERLRRRGVRPSDLRTRAEREVMAEWLAALTLVRAGG